MKRRQVLGALSALTSGVVVGTGAFTSVSAERTVSVRVADDDEALLKLTQRGDGRRSYSDGGPETVGFDIPGPSESAYGGTDPEGVGTDSVYRFSGDGGHDEPGLFGAVNQGTQPVEIYSTQQTTDGIPEVALYDIETGSVLTEASPSQPIDVGNQLLCGLEVDTSGVDIQQTPYNVTLSINALGIDSD